MADLKAFLLIKKVKLVLKLFIDFYKVLKNSKASGKCVSSINNY